MNVYKGFWLILLNMSSVRHIHLINDSCVTGPLTYTEFDGTTTLYGVVQHGTAIAGGKRKVTYGRVAEPSIMRWIKRKTLDGEKLMEN